MQSWNKWRWQQRKFFTTRCMNGIILGWTESRFTLKTGSNHFTLKMKNSRKSWISKRNLKAHDFLENAKIISDLANFPFDKRVIFEMVIFLLFECWFQKFKEWENANLNAHIDELWLGIVLITTKWDLVKKTWLKKFWCWNICIQSCWTPK